jgi:hypothetical protein
LNRCVEIAIQMQGPAAGMWLAARSRQTRQPFYQVTSDRSLTGGGWSKLEEET